MRRRLRFGLLLACMGLLWATAGAHGEVLFSDSFDSCDGSGWEFGSHSGAYSSLDCQDGGCCGRQSVTSGSCQQSVFWAHGIDYVGDELFVRAFWKFPVDYRFGGPDACSGIDFKAVIFETTGGANRCFLNFRTKTATSAEIAFLCEGTEEGWITGTGRSIVADGLWHSLEVQLTRQAAGGHVRVWIDETKFIDTAKRVCWPGECPMITEVKVGAYQNWSAPADQTFFLDNVTMSTTRIGASAAVVPPPVSGLRRTDTVTP